MLGYSDKIIEVGQVNDPGLMSRLHIIDYERMNGGMFGSGWGAIQAINNLVLYGYDYAVSELHLGAFPEQPGFPGWQHAGDHEETGRKLWNMFKTQYPREVLNFHDSPDFSGKLNLDGFQLNFYGDVGKVSPIAFFDTLQCLFPGDLWISILPDRQVVLSQNVNGYVLRRYRLACKTSPENRPESIETFMDEIGYRPDFTIDQSVAWLVSEKVWTEKQAKAFLKIFKQESGPQQLHLFG